MEEEDDVVEQLVHESDEDIEEDQGDIKNNVLNEGSIHDDVLDEELEEAKQNVGDYVSDDDMFGIDDNDYDDVDMDNILNIKFEPDDIDD